VFLPDIGMEIDFGGVVKEYAVDAALGITEKEES
jgi:thiamine biosynthesis lipoprotein ApbE